MRQELRNEIIAAACHQAWYAYAVLALGEPGDPWGTAPEWQKDSIRSAVIFWDTFMEHERLVEPLSEEVIETLCGASHRNWCQDKRTDGWTYGPKKDPEKKEHPCLVDYDNLPDAQRVKDRVVVEAYLALRPLFSSK